MGISKELIDQAGHIIYAIVINLPVAFLLVAGTGWWTPVVTGYIGFMYQMYAEHGQHFPDEGWRWLWSGSGRWLDVGVTTTTSIVIGVVAVIVTHARGGPSIGN